MKEATLNIYIEKKQRKELDNLKVKYRLSLTTIVDILCEITWDCLFLNADENTKNRFLNQNLYIKGNKTCIKMPKWLKNQEMTHKAKYANNVLQAYLHHDIDIWIKKDIIEGKHGYWNRINKELQTREDDWWRFNEAIRQQQRAERTLNGTKSKNKNISLPDDNA